MGLKSFIHSFVPATPEGAGKRPLLLLPRTGGTELDLISLGRALSPGAALLSVRGNVLEDGKPRFFRRFGRGQFDVDDLRERTTQLGRFIRAAREAYRIEAPVAVGHSNGANIAWSLIFSDPSSLSGAVLFRPLMPIDPVWAQKAGPLPVLILSGADDTIAPPREVVALSVRLRELGADVSHELLPAAHDLIATDEAIAGAWLRQTFGRRHALDRAGEQGGHR
jgi:phospholipase/carboxylesterase